MEIEGYRVALTHSRTGVNVFAGKKPVNCLPVAQFLERLLQPPCMFGVLHEQDGHVFGRYPTRREAEDRAAEARGNGVAARVVEMRT